MILSVSRRTDIPAFYLDWFFNRIEEGYVLVRNPMNSHQLSKVNLSPSVIDCIVFWTKDPSAITKRIEQLSDYHYYFQVTINAYDYKIERNVPMRADIIESFHSLSRKIGQEKTIWRYDPIIITDTIDINFHANAFEALATKLEGYTSRCVISFIDAYKKTERNMKHINASMIDNQMMQKIGERLSTIAMSHNISLETCSETVDLSPVGIKHAKCIDGRLIAEIVGQNINVDKDKNQRDICGCVASIDIGAYNTCKHGCLYCYANFSATAVNNSLLKHNPNSPMLIGDLEPENKVTERKMESYIDSQLRLF